MTSRLAVLVTGSRDWNDRDAVIAALNRVDGMFNERVLIHGDARGLDRMAAEIAAASGWTVLAMPASWDELGSSAGPVRNREMVRVLCALLVCGYECRALAFPLPESRGTWQCVRVAKDAGFDPVIVKSEAE